MKEKLREWKCYPQRPNSGRKLHLYIIEESVLSSGNNFNAVRRVSWNVNDLSKSSKATRMLEIIEEAKAEGRKVIIFSFYLDVIEKISELLGSQCTEPINGSVTPNRRQEIIDDFDNAPAGKVLISQIIAGGTGLNIQSASVVIFCEPQLKPSILQEPTGWDKLGMYWFIVCSAKIQLMKE